MVYEKVSGEKPKLGFGLTPEKTVIRYQYVMIIFSRKLLQLGYEPLEKENGNSGCKYF